MELNSIASPYPTTTTLTFTNAASKYQAAAQQPGNTINSNYQTEAVQPGNTSSNNPAELSTEEMKKVEELQTRDREVRLHEQAHLAAAGVLAESGSNYQYEVGPDGRKYAVEGSVEISTSPIEGDPKATLQRARQIQKAALAPVDPSNKDRQVANEARRMEAEAIKELAAQKQDEHQAYDNAGAATVMAYSANTISMTV